LGSYGIIRSVIGVVALEEDKPLLFTLVFWKWRSIFDCNPQLSLNFLVLLLEPIVRLEQLFVLIFDFLK
jgi:hypothetical protein